MLAHVVAVIARKHDHGVVGEAEAVEGRDHAADLGVEEADARGVGLAGLSPLFVGHFVLFPLATLERRGRNVGSILGYARHHGHLALGIEIEVATGRHVGRVRPVEADGQEEGPRAVGGALRQDLFGPRCDEPVGVGRVGGGRGEPTERGPKLTRLEREDLRLFLEVIDAGGIEGRLP